LNETAFSVSKSSMKHSTLVVSWTDGLKFRPAARIIRTAQQFHSSVALRCGERIADVRSILGIVALCATLGASITIEASGEDEDRAVEAIAKVFASGDADFD